MVAQSIDQVIALLDEIIEQCTLENSRLGYFPALYRQVTIKVKQDIQAGLFEDGSRMEALDVRFANRYFEAYANFRGGRSPTHSWRFAFNVAEKWWPIVFQHLLLGMNAHINLDLGIAAAQTAPGKAIYGLENDFLQINAILASLIDDVQKRLSKVWPLLYVLDYVSGRLDEKIAKFSMDRARNEAWNVALRFSELPQKKIVYQIEQLDQSVARFAKIVYNPGFIFDSMFKIIRFGELKRVPDIIRILR